MPSHPAFFLRCLAIAALLLAGMAHGTERTEAVKRVALVIGNAAYPSAPLSNPVNDAHDMAAALKKLNFDVIEKPTPRRRT